MLENLRGFKFINQSNLGYKEISRKKRTIWGGWRWATSMFGASQPAAACSTHALPHEGRQQLQQLLPPPSVAYLHNGHGSAGYETLPERLQTQSRVSLLHQNTQLSTTPPDLHISLSSGAAAIPVLLWAVWQKLSSSLVLCWQAHAVLCMWVWPWCFCASSYHNHSMDIVFPVQGGCVPTRGHLSLHDTSTAQCMHNITHASELLELCHHASAMRSHKTTTA